MRSFVCRIVSLVLLASVAPVAAQTYPSRPITIVVGYPPGATSDLLARTVGEPLAAALGATSRPPMWRARRATATRCWSAPTR